MKHRGKRPGSILLCAALIAALLPARAGAAFEHMEVERNLPQSTVDHEAKIRSLKDGEVYTYTEVSLQDPAGNALPNTDFSVSLAAVGQKYPTTTTTIRPTVTVLVLDTSGSMGDPMGDNRNKTRMAALKESAKSFINTVVSTNSGNYVAVVTYETVAKKSINFTNTASRLITNIDNLSSDGGTNSQAGLIAAYKMINKPTDYDLPANLVNPVYSVVFMSDGEPTYYYQLSKNNTVVDNNQREIFQNLDFTGSLSKGKNDYFTRQGPGNSTNQSAETMKTISDNAIAAAGVLKGDTTRNPTVYSIYLKNSTAADTKAAAIMGKIASAPSDKNTFTPGTTTDLTKTFADIAVSIKSQATPPIAEVVEGSGLSPVSYVDMSYNLGSGFALVGKTMQVSLGDTLHTLTQQHNGTYKGTDNSGLAKLEVKAENGVVNFRVPASLLPCNEPEPKTGTKTVVKPIKLFFTLRINPTEATKEGVYPTASASTARFYPTEENPFYTRPVEKVVTTAVAKKETKTDKDYYKYRATYPNSEFAPANVPLTSFQAGEGAALSYVDLSQVQSAKLEDSKLIVKYSGKEIAFPTISSKTAGLSFTAPTQNAAVNQFTDVKFTDGEGNTYTGSQITLTKESNGIRVTYQSGKRSVLFTAVSYTPEDVYKTAKVTLKAQWVWDGLWGSYVYSISNFKIDGDNESDAKINGNVTQTGGMFSGYRYHFKVIAKGEEWSFSNAELDKESTSTQQKMGVIYKASLSQPYYITDFSEDRIVTVEDFRFTREGGGLQVEKWSNNAWGRIGNHPAGADTVIVGNASDGYTVTVTGQSTVTTTIYTVKDNILSRQVIETKVGGVDATGWVTQTHSDFGVITLTVKLTAGDIITTAKLTSLSGTNLAVANSSGSADLLLTLTISGDVTGISGLDLTDALKLSVKSGDNMPGTFAYEIKGVKRGGTVIAEYTGTLVPGTYQITLSTKSIYSNPKLKPGSATVSLEIIRFAINDGANNFTLEGSGQSVKLVLVTTTGH